MPAARVAAGTPGGSIPPSACDVARGAVASAGRPSGSRSGATVQFLDRVWCSYKDGCINLSCSATNFRRSDAPGTPGTALGPPPGYPRTALGEMRSRRRVFFPPVEGEKRSGGYKSGLRTPRSRMGVGNRPSDLCPGGQQQNRGREPAYPPAGCLSNFRTLCPRKLVGSVLVAWL